MKKRILSALLAASMTASVIMSGCSDVPESTAPPPASATAPAEATVPPETTVPPTTVPVETVTEPVETLPPETTVPAEPSLTDEQRKSINMLNYLTLLTIELNEYSTDRIFLEDAYTQLLNTKPSIFDTDTSEQYDSFFQTIESYLLIDLSRQRLNHIYNQNQALCLLDLVPCEKTVSKVTALFKSQNKLSLFVNATLVVEHSTTNFLNGVREEEVDFLKDSLTLDRDALSTLFDSRKSLFKYMVGVVQSYGLDDQMTLSETYARDFLDHKYDDNNKNRIYWLENKVDTYQYLGDYWLLLAKSYYLNGQYEECLNAVRNYEDLSISILRENAQYAEILELAIVSAKEVFSEDEYIHFADTYLPVIKDNAGWYNWESQYFTCMTYLDIYAITQDTRYLDSAYETAFNALTYLVSDQKELNEFYLTALSVPETDESGRALSKVEQKAYKQYIKILRKNRETELAPVYEPLRLFFDLYLSIAGWTDYGHDESILRNDDAPIFLDRTLDNEYRFGSAGLEVCSEDIEVSFEGDSFTIPGEFVSSISRIVVTFDGQVVPDWQVKKVNRSKSEEIADFTVTFESEAAKELKIQNGAIIQVEIYPYENAPEHLTFSFQAAFKDFWGYTYSTDFTRI